MRPFERYALLLDFGLLPTEWQRYAGFDGDVLRDSSEWEPLFKAVPRVDAVRKNGRHANTGAPRGIFISTDLQRSSPRADFDFVGFDAGWYGSIYSHYSLIANHLSMHGSAVGLNAHMLFDRHEDAIGLVEEWHEWTPDVPGDKEGLPGDELIQAFAVFQAPPLPRTPTP